MKSRKAILIVTLVLVISCVLAIYMNSSVAITAFQKNSADNHSFSDVTENDWFYDDVGYVYENGLMQGVGDDIFSPHSQTTRAMLVTILWRLEGSPTGLNVTFSDVKTTDYFYNAVAWAFSNNIVSGYSSDKFAPGDSATREQLVAIIHRYASFKKYPVSMSASMESYVDRSSVSEYAIDAFEWAIANNVITGTSVDKLSPKSCVQRSQVAAILHRFCELPYVNGYTQSDNLSGKNDKNTHGSSGGGSVESEGVFDDGSIEEDSTDDISTVISVDNVNAKPGEEVQIVTRVDNNPGILGMSLFAYFDDVNLELTGVENGNAFEDVLEMTTSKVLDNGAKILWDGMDITEENIRDGEIMVMKFKISDSAPPGKYPIILKCFDDDIVDKELKNISAQIKSGCIMISTG